MRGEAKATVTLELPGLLPPEVADEPAAFAREMRLAAAVFWYQREVVSQGRAAEIAGLTRADFIAALGRLGVPAIQTSVDEVLAELASQRRA